MIGRGIGDVYEDRVVLGRPPPAGARAVVIRPDDLVEKALAAEDLVQQQPAVVGLAVVDVEVQRSLAREQPVGLQQARVQEREIVVERVPIGGLGEQTRGVAAALKSGAIAFGVVDRAECATRL